jgi:hypothetical protein
MSQAPWGSRRVWISILMIRRPDDMGTVAFYGWYCHNAARFAPGGASMKEAG